jgi:hypothetical protein
LATAENAAVPGSLERTRVMGRKATFEIKEATIAGIHAAYHNGTLTARQLVEGYLERIETYDKKGPAINAVI